MFTTKEKEDALKVYEEVKSMTSVIQRLGYLTRRAFYQWLREKNNPVKKIKPPRKRINSGLYHPGDKVYLSLIVDCFDGMVVTWTAGTNPNAALVNEMLVQAVRNKILDVGERLLAG